MPFWLRPISSSSQGAEEVSIGLPTLSAASAHSDEKRNVSSSSGSSKLVTMPVEPPDPLLPAPILYRVRTTTSVNSRQRKQKKNARISGGLRVHWASFKKRIGTVTAPSTSSVMGESSAAGSYHRKQPAEDDDDNDEVDEVVVDRTWTEEIKSSVAHSEAGASPEKSDGLRQPGTSVDHESIEHHSGFWGLWTPLLVLRWRIYPFIVDFFTSSYFDPNAEQHYLKENWFMRKVRGI